MKKTRKNGFYWIRLSDEKWEVAEWLEAIHSWKISNGGFNDDELLEIDETPIIRDSKFKVEPGLSLQQCKDEVAKTYLSVDVHDLPLEYYENWDQMERKLISRGLSSLITERMTEAVELYTASLASEIKGLREKIVALEKDIDIAYKSGYHEGKEDARDIDWPDGQRKGY